MSKLVIEGHGLPRDLLVQMLGKPGADAQRVRDAGPSFGVSAILNLGAVRTYDVLATKRRGEGPGQT